MRRRQFLHPRHLAHTAGQLIAAGEELASLESASTARASAAPLCSFLRFGHQAMATGFELLLPFGTPHALDMADEVMTAIDRLEDQLSAYRHSSEICAINRDAFAASMRVEEGLFDLLTQSGRWSRETEGAFDIAQGALIKAWGFFRGPKKVPSPHELSRARSMSGSAHLQLNTEGRSVRILRQGVEINLGAVGKGYALDCVMNRLQESWNCKSALVHGGRSSVYALGSEPGTDRGWTVAVLHPWEADKRLGHLSLRDQGLGTSAMTYQHLEYQGKKLGHILDPRTGWPARGIASATVVAPSAAQADALATAFFILGVDKAEAYCRRHPDVGALMLPEGEAEPVVLGSAIRFADQPGERLDE